MRDEEESSQTFELLKRIKNVQDQHQPYASMCILCKLYTSNLKIKRMWVKMRENQQVLVIHLKMLMKHKGVKSEEVVEVVNAA